MRRTSSCGRRRRAIGICPWLTLLAFASAPQAAELSLQIQAPAGRSPEDAVVMLEPLDGRAPLKPAQEVEITQQGRQFRPRVTVVPVGTAVSFPNLDTVRHHVYSFSEAKPFELKLYVGRPEKPVVFDKPGIVVLGCNIHDQMAAWVVVANTPWAQRVDASGLLRWRDLPEGDYRVRVWHPELPPQQATVTESVRLGKAPVAKQLRLELK